MITSRRGGRNISPEDLLFLLRHDVNRSARLKEFLSWKDVRKNAKATTTGSSNSGSSGGGVGAGEGNLTNSLNLDEAMGGDDSALVAEIEEDAKTLAAADNTQHDPDSRSTDLSSSKSNNNTSSNNISSNTSSNSNNVQIGPKRRQLGLFWDLGHGLLADLPGSVGSFNDGTSLTSYDSRDQSTCQRETLRRLRHADLLTLSMCQSEYMEYSECRQASFTYKKSRKFREWLVGGTARPGSLALSTLAGGSCRDLAKLTDDSLEILGFLAYEIVQKLTEVSLAVKYEFERREIEKIAGTALSPLNNNNNLISANSVLSGLFTGSQSSTSTNTNTNTNTSTSTTKTPIQAHHIEEAYRKLISVNLDGFNLFHHNLNKKRKFIL